MSWLKAIWAVSQARRYTDKKLSGSFNGMSWKGSVNYQKDLPGNAKSGDAYTVRYKGTSGTESDGGEYAWGLEDGTMKWIPVGRRIASVQGNALIINN